MQPVESGHSTSRSEETVAKDQVAGKVALAALQSNFWFAVDASNRA